MIQNLSRLLIAGLLLAIPLAAQAGTITGSGTARFIPKFSDTTSINNSVIYQHTDSLGDGEYIGIRTTKPFGQLGFRSSNAYEIFGADSAKHFNIACGGPMHLQPGLNRLGFTDNPLATLGLGAGGDADLFLLEKKRLTVSTNVGVGLGVTPDTNFTTGHRLKVCGTIKSKGITTDVSGWCDDVFHPGYELLSLPALEASIREHGHLPGVPSEAEVLEHGVELGAMTTTLLRKVEELTLHVIELQKQNTTLKARLDASGGR